MKAALTPSVRRAYMELARLLQPAMVVIEDVDLIARDRGEMGGPCEEALLNKLLNEMDGLREDADILFVLTTNRPQELESALAGRPGRIDQASERSASRLPMKPSTLRSNQPQGLLRQDHALTRDRRQAVNGDPPRAAAVARPALEGQDLAAVGPRRTDGFLQFGERTADERFAGRAWRDRDLDPDHCPAFFVALDTEEHGVAEFARAAQPQPILQALHGRGLADIDLVVLRRRDHRRVALRAHAAGNRRLVAKLLVNTVEVERGSEQFVDRGLHIGAHVSRKLPCRRDQPLPGNTCEMPTDGLSGECHFGLLSAGLGRFGDRRNRGVAE
jgi:hypothetical protein